MIAESRYASQDIVEVGIGGFISFARINERIELTASAPVSHLEDGSFASDHIITNPVTLSIEGSVSDIHIRDSHTDTFFGIDGIDQGVGEMSSYLSSHTAFQLTKIRSMVVSTKTRFTEIDSRISRGSQFLDFYGNKSEEKKLSERFIDEMNAIYYNKQLISIDMPYNTYKNMAIISLSVTRDNKDKCLSFSLSAQEIRMAKTILVDSRQYYKKPTKKIAGQIKGATQKGAQSGEKIDKTMNSAFWWLVK